MLKKLFNGLGVGDDMHCGGLEKGIESTDKGTMNICRDWLWFHSHQTQATEVLKGLEVGMVK